MNYKTLGDVKQAIEHGVDAAIDKFWESYQHGIQYNVWLNDRMSEYSTVSAITEPTKSFNEWLQEREVLTGTRGIVQPDGSVIQESFTYDGDLLREFKPSTVTALVSDLPEYQSYLKKKGKLYDGVMIPLDKDAQDTLTALYIAFQNGLIETTIEFSNNVKYHVDQTKFTALSEWFVIERNKFFT